MASACFANQEPALPISDKNMTIGACLAMVIFLPACGFVDLSVKHLNLDESNARSDQLATINLHYDDDEFVPPYKLELVRTRTSKGYAVRAPLYQEEKGALHFAVAKQKDLKWFFGFQGRWEF